VKINSQGLDRAGISGALRTKIRASGSQKAIAEQAGVSEQYLSAVLSGKEPSQAILNVIGVRKTVKRVVTYHMESQS
jgi:hypothetical protein